MFRTGNPSPTQWFDPGPYTPSTFFTSDIFLFLRTTLSAALRSHTFVCAFLRQSTRSAKSQSTKRTDQRLTICFAFICNRFFHRLLVIFKRLTNQLGTGLC